MTQITCTCCGGKGTMNETYLGSVSYCVLRAVRAAHTGITVEELIVKVYGANGGPASARQSVQVIIQNLNRRLINAKIVANKKGPGALYRLVSTK